MAAPHWQTVAGFRRDPDAIRDSHLDRHVLRRVLTYARPYRWLLVGFIVTVVAGAVVSVLPPLLLRALLDTAVPDENTALVGWLALGAVVLAILAAGLSLAQRLYSARVGEGLIHDLRVSLFDHVQRLPLSFFTRTQTGALQTRLNNDVVGAQQAVTGTLGTVASNTINIVVTLVVMFALEWRLTLLTLAVLPAFVIPARRVGRKLQKATRESMELNAEMNTTITERFNVSGALLVKLFGRHGTERDRFDDRAARVRDIGVQTAMYARTIFAALAFVAAVGTAIVYYIGGRLAISGTIEIGTLVAFVVYVGQIYTPLTQLTNARVDVMTAVVSFERVFEVLDFESLIPDADDAVDLENATGRIEFDHVWFRHPPGSLTSIASLEADDTHRADDDTLVLKDVSFTVEPGETVALVGPSGAGKTTIAMMLPRIHEVSEGAVLVDGHDVGGLTQESLRASIGFVSQDPHMFHETIRENLTFSKPDATDEELVSACKAARIHDLIASLPDGYNTLVGERGYRLSGGEKQRMAIARVLLKDPAIVILDEATSHLDSESEAMIQRALAEALHGRTALVIAHRLSTVVSSDRILVIDDGRIVESGTHAELLAHGGLYAELTRTQLGGHREDPTTDGGDTAESDPLSALLGGETPRPAV